MDIQEQLTEINRRLDTLNFEVGKLVGMQRTTHLLIKFVILPLLAIVAGLAGVTIY